MKKFLSKIKKEKKTILAIVLFCFVFVLFYKVRLVFAAAATALGQWTGVAALGSLGTTLALVLGAIAYILTAVLGLVLTVLVQILIAVAQFNHIIDVPTVIDGWVMVRDLCNMFFILILLVISFATILRVENYSLKKMLPKLLIMAVLINFSKTIFGLLIDFSQVIMLTFVNSFKEGGGWFMDMFRVDLWHSLSTKEALEANLKSYGLTPWATSLAVIMGVIAAIITVIVIAAMLAVLVMRVVMLWIYTILSPLVFLGFAFPPLQKYTGQIWEDFTKQLVIGPALAFFIWLALTTAGKSSEKMYMIGNDELCAGIGAFFCQNNLQKFIIVIGLLVGGLMVAQQMGGFIAKAASGGAKAAGWGLKTGGNWAALKVKSGAISELLAKKTVDEKTGKVSWEGKGGLGKFGAGLAGTLYGLELRPTEMVRGVGRALKAKGVEDEMKGYVASAEGLKRGGMLGLVKGLGVSEDLTSSLAHGFLWWKGFKKAQLITKVSETKRDELLEKIETAKKGLGYTNENIAKVDDDIAGENINIKISKSGIEEYKKEIEEIKKKEELTPEDIEEIGELDKTLTITITEKEKTEISIKERKEKMEEKKKIPQPTEEDKKEIGELDNLLKVDADRLYELNKRTRELKAEKGKIKEKRKLTDKDKARIAELEGSKGEAEGNIADANLNIEELKEERKKMEKNIISPEKEKEIQEKIREDEKKLEKWQPIQTFHADRAREALIAEGKKKLGDNDNEEELFAMMKDSVNSNEQGTAAAIFLHAASVYHGNEMIQRWKSTRDVKDKEGNTVIKEGKSLPQNVLGLHTLINQAFIEGLGMAEQQAYALEREASTIFKEKGHLNYGSEAVGLKNGMLFQRDMAEQQKRARGEARKLDPERSLRNFNRLAWCDEHQEEYVDENGKIQPRRIPAVSDLGKMNFLEWIDGVAAEVGRGRFNANAAQNIYKDREAFLKWVDEIEAKMPDKRIYFEDPKTKRKVETTYRKVAESLVNYGGKIDKAEKLMERASKIKFKAEEK